jgi:hypothetical protein
VRATYLASDSLDPRDRDIVQKSHLFSVMITKALMFFARLKNSVKRGNAVAMATLIDQERGYGFVSLPPERNIFPVAHMSLVESKICLFLILVCCLEDDVSCLDDLF